MSSDPVRQTEDSRPGQAQGRSNFFGLAGLALVAVVVCGCKASYHKRAADKEVYGIIQKLEGQIFGRTNAFSIDTSYSGRRPEDILPPELIEDRLQSNRRVLTIEDALDLAVKNSRRYQSEKEQLYLTALTLTGERYAFSPQFFLSSVGNLTRRSDGEVVGSVGTDMGVSQLLQSGGRLGLTLANDLLRFYTGSPRRSAINTISVNLAQPLLRGFGRNNPAVESLTQAERNTVYAVRNFSFFQDEFAVEIVNDYFALLAQKDVIRNRYTNYLGRVFMTKRLEARKDREKLSDVDQARQSELTAKNNYVNAVANYRNALNQFKIKLGLPVSETVFLDDEALTELERAGLIPTALSVEAAYRVAVQRQLPLLNAIDRFEDAQRKVRVAADRLRPELNLLGGASLASDEPTDYTKFDPDKFRGNVGLEFDLPIHPVPARNAYRAALVNFEAAIRNLTLTLDNLLEDIQRGLRTLEQRRQNYEIQTNALALANRRVASNLQLLQAGRVEVRDLLESQDAQIAAENAVTAARVDYQVSRLQLLLDIGALRTDVPKFWLKDPLPEFLPAAAPPRLPPSMAEQPLVPPPAVFDN